jgi:hypothetical protein
MNEKTIIRKQNEKHMLPLEGRLAYSVSEASQLVGVSYTTLGAQKPLEVLIIPWSGVRIPLGPNDLRKILQNGLLADNPARSIRKVRVSGKSPRLPSAAQFAEMIDSSGA